jgi:hypothetical protein
MNSVQHSGLSSLLSRRPGDLVLGFQFHGICYAFRFYFERLLVHRGFGVESMPIDGVLGVSV